MHEDRARCEEGSRLRRRLNLCRVRGVEEHGIGVELDALEEEHLERIIMGERENEPKVGGSPEE